MSTHDESTARVLRRALTEEAGGVEPTAAGLEAIRRRTAHGAGRPGRSRWVFAAAGVGIATAAVVTAVVLLGPTGPGAGTVPRGSVPSAAVHEGVYDPAAPSAAQVTMYYVGPRQKDPTKPPYLYAERHTVTPSGGSRQLEAVHEFLTSTPIDPDYRSGWPRGVDVKTVSTAHGVTTIALQGSADLGTRPLPVPFDPSRAVAVQALLETAGITGRADFTYNGTHLDLVLYGSASLRARPAAGLRAPVSIDNLVNGQVVDSPVTIAVSGNTFEGNVGWQLLDHTGRKLADGYVTASQGTWTEVPVRLGALRSGTYTFRAFEPGGTGARLFTDDKVFTVD